MKKLMVDRIIITDMIRMFFMFCIIICKIIHFNMNPMVGGIPAKDRIIIKILNLLFLSICCIKFFILILLKFIIIGIEIIM